MNESSNARPRVGAQVSAAPLEERGFSSAATATTALELKPADFKPDAPNAADVGKPTSKERAARS